MQPVDPLAVPAVRLRTPPQLVAVAGIDQEDLKPLGLEQLVQGEPVDAGRSQGDWVDPMRTQEGRNGLQARCTGRALSRQAGIRCGAEPDADAVAARTDVDASRVR